MLNALGALGEAPFFVLNSDTIWEDGPTPALRRLADAWDPERMDALMLLHPTVAAFGYAGDGDFFMDIEGRLERRGESQIAPFVFTGSQILNPELFDGLAPGRFSLNLGLRTGRSKTAVCSASATTAPGIMSARRRASADQPAL